MLGVTQSEEARGQPPNEPGLLERLELRLQMLLWEHVLSLLCPHDLVSVALLSRRWHLLACMFASCSVLPAWVPMRMGDTPGPRHRGRHRRQTAAPPLLRRLLATSRRVDLGLGPADLVSVSASSGDAQQLASLPSTLSSWAHGARSVVDGALPVADAAELSPFCRAIPIVLRTDSGRRGSVARGRGRWDAGRGLVRAFDRAERLEAPSRRRSAGCAGRQRLAAPRPTGHSALCRSLRRIGPVERPDRAESAQLVQMRR